MIVVHQAEDLMSVLGHELRSPLTAIRGAATLLLQAHQELPPEKVVELLAVIDSAAARMADRIEDVLAAAGASVAVFDNSPRQLGRDEEVAAREGLALETVLAICVT